VKPSGSRTQEELDYELALKLDEQFRLESKALREAQEQADARIAQELARLEYGQGYSHNPLYQTQNLLDLDVPPVPVAPSISANPFNYTAVDPEYRRRQEEADEALARQLEEQFKEERSQRARENRPHSADFLLFDDSISAAAPVSSLRSTRGVSTEQLTQPLNSINDVVQCPICGVLFEQGMINRFFPRQSCFSANSLSFQTLWRRMLICALMSCKMFLRAHLNLNKCQYYLKKP